MRDGISYQEWVRTWQESPVRTLRKSRGLTMRELAGKTGMDVSFLSRIEQGNVRLRPDHLRRIAASLGCAIAELTVE